MISQSSDKRKLQHTTAIQPVTPNEEIPIFELPLDKFSADYRKAISALSKQKWKTSISKNAATSTLIISGWWLLKEVPHKTSFALQKSFITLQFIQVLLKNRATISDI